MTPAVPSPARGGGEGWRHEGEREEDGDPNPPSMGPQPVLPAIRPSAGERKQWPSRADDESSLHVLMSATCGTAFPGRSIRSVGRWLGHLEGEMAHPDARRLPVASAWDFRGNGACSP